MSALISIIVPVYNFEDCLRRCVDSILCQTYSNIELILIDDGSGDCSGAICDEYCDLDGRVKVVHKYNGGASEARNYGLELAEGEYIGFVDGDDFVDPDFYQTLYDLAEGYEADIAMVSYRKIDKNMIMSKDASENISVMGREEAVKELLIDGKVQNYVWNKLYRRDLFHDIRFPVGIVYDDINIMYELFKKSNKVVYWGSAKYSYCIRETGIIHMSTSRNREEALSEVLKRYYAAERDFPSLRQYNAYAFVLWMVRLYTYTAKEGDGDIGYVIAHVPMLMRLYEEFSDLIINRLNPLKRVILFIMLWNAERGLGIVPKLI